MRKASDLVQPSNASRERIEFRIGVTSIVGSMAHHWTPVCWSAGFPVPPIVVPAAYAVAASMTVCAAQRTPLR